MKILRATTIESLSPALDFVRSPNKITLNLYPRAWNKGLGKGAYMGNFPLNGNYLNTLKSEWLRVLVIYIFSVFLLATTLAKALT